MLPAQRRHMRKHAVNVSDIVSPTSRHLRKKRPDTVIFPDGTSPNEQKQKSKEEEADLLFKEMPPCDKEKAKTFRKRRLSLNPMDDDVIEQARKQHAQELGNSAATDPKSGEGDEPAPP